MTSTALAAPAPSFIRFQFGLGLEEFTYNEAHPLQPNLSAQNFQQISLQGQAAVEIWIIPRSTQLIFMGDATLLPLHLSDSGKPVRLYDGRMGLKQNLFSIDRTDFAIAVGFASMTMQTTARPWGYEYLRGPWINSKISYILDENASDPTTLSFIPQLTWLGSDWFGAFNFADREISLGMQLNLPVSKGKFPKFLYQKNIFFSAYYETLAYDFPGVRVISVSDSKIRLAVGYEF